MHRRRCWEQLAEKYLASIPAQDSPAKRSPNQLTPIKFCFPDHVVQEDVRQAKPAPWPGFEIHAHRFHDPHVKHQIHGSHVTRSMCPVWSAQHSSWPCCMLIGHCTGQEQPCFIVDLPR